MKTSILSIAIMAIVGFAFSFDWISTVRKIEYNKGAFDANKKINAVLRGVLDHVKEIEEERSKTNED